MAAGNCFWLCVCLGISNPVCTIHFFPSFLGTKNTGDIWGDLEGHIYSFNWSSRNTVTSSYSAGDRGIMWPFFDLNVSLRSIAWSHPWGFLSGMCSDSFFKNTFRNLWYSFGTSSSGVFSVGFSCCASSARIVLWIWYIIFESGLCLVKVHSLHGLGWVLALALFFLFDAFILISGGCSFFFFLGTLCLLTAFVAVGRILFMSSAKELAFTALQHWFFTFFGEVVSTTVKTLIIATPGNINVPCLGPFHHSWLDEI